MAIVDDGNHAFSSSVTLNLNCEQFNRALSQSIIEAGNTYNLNSYNCTDFGISIANAVGLGVEDTTSPWVFNGTTYGNSSNPGDLGEDIKLSTNGLVNSEGGTAPLTNCN